MGGQQDSNILLQFYFDWRTLRKMLRFLALLPMQSAFQRQRQFMASAAHELLQSRRSTGKVILTFPG